MRINTGFNKFKKIHSKKKHQVLFRAKNCKEYHKVENLFKFLLAEKNSFIFESVEKRRIRGRYTIIGSDPDKIWEFNKKKIYIIKNNHKKEIKRKPYPFLKQLWKPIQT